MLARALYLSRKGKEDPAGISFVPWWYEPLALYREYKCERGDYGVDFSQWHWCIWGQMARRSEALAQDDEWFKKLENELVSHPEVKESKRAAREKILAQQK